MIHEVSFVAVRRDGHRGSSGRTVVRPPSAWTAEDAKQVIWGLIRQLDAFGVYRVDLKPSIPPVEWILEVDGDTGKIVTQPLVLSSKAAVWLESCQFTLPESRAVQ